MPVALSAHVSPEPPAAAAAPAPALNYAPPRKSLPRLLRRLLVALFLLTVAAAWPLCAASYENVFASLDWILGRTSTGVTCTIICNHTGFGMTINVKRYMWDDGQTRYRATRPHQTSARDFSLGAAAPRVGPHAGHRPLPVLRREAKARFSVHAPRPESRPLVHRPGADGTVETPRQRDRLRDLAGPSDVAARAALVRRRHAAPVARNAPVHSVSPSPPRARAK